VDFELPPIRRFAPRFCAMAGRRTETYAGHGPKIGASGKFEGDFKVQQGAPFLDRRLEIWQRLYNKHCENVSKQERKPIKITLPDGTVKEGTAWETSPFDIAAGIAKGLADSAVIANVTYTEPVASMQEAVAAADDDESEGEDEPGAPARAAKTVQWDLKRPLEGSCKLELLKFDSDEGKDTFWHSSAHILGQALENEFGVHLTIGPPLDNGFYYDSYMGSRPMTEKDYKPLEDQVVKISKEDQPFERLVLTKDEALELFQENPFKVQLITNKVPEGSKTSAYRCGKLIDLCRGPHVPSTGKIKAFKVEKHSATYWLGKNSNDSLQRVYAVAFPTEKDMKVHQKNKDEAEKRKHTNVGKQQELFFFHPVASPGSCFWLPHGARLFNSLVEFMKKEYRGRGFKEVITPNIYNAELFQQSGHYAAYKKNMYPVLVEGEEWYLKPMNCPGHCMVFDNRLRSYKELPMRMATFGVLHRNEETGALHGLVRVRRFQQDDAHIFCRHDQIKDEVSGALEFLLYTYKVFGLESSFVLSTRPKKAIGSREVWDKAEAALEQALNECGLPWKLNPGDGAFYGPKIDIKVKDALGRRHQCATIQLDFNLPMRFNLQYKTEAAGEADDEPEVKEKVDKKADKEKKSEEPNGEPAAAAPKPGEKKEYVWKEGKLRTGCERPAMIHRAIMGSIERFTAILCEHYGGKWPFFISPRQCIVCSIKTKGADYAEYVARQLTLRGFAAEVDATNKDIRAKVKQATKDQWNYIAVVGDTEAEKFVVNLRTRGSEKSEEVTLQELFGRFEEENNINSFDPTKFEPFKGKATS